MASASTGSTKGSGTSPGTKASARGCAPRIGRRRKARSSGSTAISKESFVWPLKSRLKGQGLILDAATANAQVGAWLRDVANRRIHAETRERPVDRFAMEKAQLLLRGSARTGIAPTVPAILHDIHVSQHDLSVYDAIGRLA
jgi:hypothetical protein